MIHFSERQAHGWTWPAILLCAMLGVVLHTTPALAQDAAALRARHTELRDALTSNQFQRPLVLQSRDQTGGDKGEIYARIELPFSVVGPALQGIENWCDIMILHLNVKGCRANSARAGSTLSVAIGRKFDQPLADAYPVEFVYKLVVATADYLQLTLKADQGPLGTSQYSVVLEAVAIDAGRSFLHLSYAYSYGMAARMAMQTYLATIGRDKVGFSIVGSRSNGAPIYIGSTRGVVERNTMRYYLAIEAYLGALSTPAPQQLEKRLNDWFTGIESYPVQLHEIHRDEYLSLKRSEVRRQQLQGG